MGSSKTLLLALLLGACAHNEAAPAVVAPVPIKYTCAQEKRLAAEYRALPPDAMLKQAMDDYHGERQQLAAVRKESAPRCQ
jgi:hypothetical protein